jgi:hypothetical protein
MSAHSFGWLGRRRHAADPLTFGRTRAAGLPLRPVDALAPQRMAAPEAAPPAPAAAPEAADTDENAPLDALSS